MSNRINDRFNKLKESGKKALIGYITAGDPSLDKLEELLVAMDEGGVDIIELGIPFSDPLADGPVIQRAAQRALKNGFTVDKLFEYLGKVRGKITAPIVFLTYYNTVFVYGEDKFVNKCREVEIDGVIIPDLPLEERDELKAKLDAVGISFIPLVAPTSHERIKKIVDGSEGFVYCVTSLGVTGVRNEFHLNLSRYIDDIRSSTNLPLCLGFGIGDTETAKEFSNFADGIIIGSVLVKKVEEIMEGKATVEDFKELVKSFKDVL